MARHAFDFDYLYYQYLPTLTATSHFLTNPYRNTSILTLTYEGCKEAVGTGFTLYNRRDVYDRVLLWRIPLIVLWATTTLPALGLHTKIFTMMHLVADPIDTFWSLFYKLDLAKRSAGWVSFEDQSHNSGPRFTFVDPVGPSNGSTELDILSRRQTIVGDPVGREALLKRKLRAEDEYILQYYQDVIALVITAYDDWGIGLAALRAVNYGFNPRRRELVMRAKLREYCASAAFYIASDRVSRFLPSCISAIVFVVQIFAGFRKTLNGLGDLYEDSDSVSRGLNRTPHNIAFGALFFWLPLAVLMTAFVGGSQTSHLIPRVLENFQRKARKCGVGQNETTVLDPESEIADFPNLSQISHQRWACGGLPVWQTAKFRDALGRSAGLGRLEVSYRDKWSSRIGLLVSFIIVAISTGCAMAVSWLTPTQGFGCRAMTQLGFFFMWIVSLGLDGAIFLAFAVVRDDMGVQQPLPLQSYTDGEFKSLRTAYWMTWFKDSFFTVLTIALLTMTALGIFNDCNCWCKWSGKVPYLSFPQEQFVFNMIKHQLKFVFPIIIGFALLTQVILFIGVTIYFSEGRRVLKQRDIDDALREPIWYRHPWKWLRARES